MLRQTVDRLGDIVPPENVLVVTNAEQRAAVLEVCPMLPPENIVAEPVGRDTAAAVGLSTLLVENRNPTAAFAMLSSDHVIHDESAFQATMEAAFSAAESEDALVTIGITATYPATGYGYVERGELSQMIGDTPVHSFLHETSHIVCMDSGRRSGLDRDAGGDALEEAAVCYLQVLLADHIAGVSRARLMTDMDTWGYSFRLGSTRDWFERDAEDAREFLLTHGLIDETGQATFLLRS